MIPFLRHLDYDLIRWTTTETSQHIWLTEVVRFAAEDLIFIFPAILFYMWMRPESQGKHHGAQKAVVMAVFATMLSLAAKSVLGFFIFRPRPFISHPELYTMHLRIDPLSFPSGHTLVAFAIASSILFSGYHKLGVSLMVMATLVGLGRIFAGVHYPSDVLAGAIIATAISWVLHREGSGLKRYLPNF